MGSENVEGYALEFDNIELSVLQSGKEKDILNGVNGRFRPGRLSAIMGPSGAGKTKLLNILSGVKSFGFKGSIKINGVQRNLQTFRQLSCYIAQEFSMFTVLTVRETLDIAAHIKVGNKIKKSERNHLILKIAKILGLTEALDTRVNKLSGGEMKRLSIGVELTTNPPIMFFDEPTSGLDSVSSLQIVTHLKSLAQEGRTIIMVVHQPSSKIVNIIDDIFILAEGKCLYNGPMDDLLPTLSSLGINCPPYYNRADLALEVACKEHGDCIEQLARLASSKHYSRLGSFYEDHKIIFKSQMDQNEEDTVTEQNVMLKKENEFVSVKLNINGNETIKKKIDKNKSSRYSVSNFTQFQILLKRSAICILRDVKLATLKLITHLLTGIALGIVYYNFGGDGSKVVSTLSCLFFMIIFVFYGTTLHTVMIFPMESAAVIREHSNNWYSLGMYQLAKTVADIPLHIVCPTLFLSIAWYLTDLPHEWDRFLRIWLVSVLLSVFAQTFGCIMGVIFEPQVGLFLAATMTMPTFLISGFFIHLNDLPPYIWWLSYISIFRYSLEASVIAVYGIGRGVLKCNVPYCHFKHPRKILEEMGMENGDYWFNADVLIMLAVVSQIVLYCTLRLKVQAISRKT